MIGALTRFANKIVLKILLSRQFDSVALRKIFLKKHGIDVGMYSYGCFDAGRIRPGVRFGRYCSVAPSVAIFTRNHPTDALTTHPVLYDEKLGLKDRIDLNFGSLEIEDDVWLGHNVTILPGVARIGRGSVIGAGSIVTSDVPRYAIVAGVPAKIIKSRFDELTIEKIEKSRWWEGSIEDLKALAEEFPDFVFSPGGGARRIHDL